MSSSPDDSTPANRKKPAGMKDLPADALSDDEVGTVSGGGAFVPCIKAIQPWRTISFMVAALAMFAMMIHILIEVVF